MQFSNAIINVTEGYNAATIGVTRTGATDRTSTVSYEVQDGTATQAHDFTYCAGQLTFNPGNTYQSFQVLIDRVSGSNQSARQAEIVLSSPAGASLGPVSRAALVITGDSSSGPPGNVIDDGPSFVRQQYEDFLNRLSDAKGQQDWEGYLGGCANTDLQCLVNRRVETSRDFFRSAEFFDTGYFIMRLYWSTLSPRPSQGAPLRPEYHEFMRDAQALHYGVAGDTAAASKLAFAQQWLQHSEIQSIYGSDQTIQQLIDHVARVARIQLAQQDRDQLAQLTRAEALVRLVDNAQVTAREYNPAYVVMQYFGYLRRDPEDKGYQDWLGYLNTHPTDDATMVYGFAYSREYRTRFGAYGDANNFPFPGKP